MSKKDLIVLVADKDMEYALKGLLARPAALGIRSVNADILVHPQHDAACAQRGVPFLAGFSDQYEYGLLMFDHEGSGKEDIPALDLQKQINEEFLRSTWGTRARAIVLSPELESWVWSDSPTLTTWQGGKIEILRFVAGWPIRAGYKRTRPNPGSPKRRSGQLCVRHKRPKARPCMSRLRTRFPCMDAATRRFMNSKAPCKVGFPKVDGMSADDGQRRTYLTTKRGHRHAGRARDNGQPRV